MAEDCVLVSISSVRFFLSCLSRQSLSVMCRASFLCMCAQARSQRSASPAADVLIIPFSSLFFFFLLSFLLFFYFAFSFSCIFLPLISTSLFFLYFPLSHRKEEMSVSSAAVFDLRNLLLHAKKAGSHLQQTIVLKCIR